MKNNDILAIKKLSIYRNYNQNEYHIDLTQKSNQLEILEYKMPKLFLDVYNAFRKEDNILMQECNKNFFDLINENQNLKKEIKQIKDDLDINKDKIIKDKIIKKN
jgi:DNA integrity scanning protein DisA with diadenylate cyclase activity